MIYAKREKSALHLRKKYTVKMHDGGAWCMTSCEIRNSILEKTSSKAKYCDAKICFKELVAVFKEKNEISERNA